MCDMIASAIATAVTLLSPVAPHICEELWQALGHDKGLTSQAWPTFDEKALVKDNGKQPRVTRNHTK